MPSRPSAYSSSIARSIDASPVESADCASYVRYPATRPRRSRHRQRPTLVPGFHRARSYLLESILHCLFTAITTLPRSLLSAEEK